MSFGSLVIEMISRMGRYHKLLLILFMAHQFNVALNHTVTTFHIYTPTYYCKANNDSECKTDCPGEYVFESKSTSVVTEFALVCKQRLYAPLLNSLYFVGVTIGAFVCGSLADIFGRRIVVLVCLYVQGFLGFCLYFNHNLPLIMVNRTLQGFFIQGVQSCTYALMLEQCNPKLRTLAGVTWQSTWGVGMIYLAMCAYLIPDWHYLQIALAVPTFVTLIWIWLIPESLTWLITRNRLDDAYNLSIKLAKWNKDEIFLSAVGNAPPSETEMIGVKQSKLIDMMKHPVLRRHAYIMATMWFSIAVAYYGILFFLPEVAGERHLNFAIGALVEIASCILGYFIFARWGRRIPMVIYQYVTGAFCLVIMILIFAAGDDWEDESNSFSMPITTLAIIGKAISVTAFCGMFIYGGECFPTGCRGGAMGLCGFFARLGCLVSPQIHVVGEYTFKGCPLLIVAICVLITGTATLLLPETLGITLPDTINDVDALWTK